VLRLVDFLALGPVAIGSPRVLAAADRLDREVRWAHVFESRDVAEMVEGGEVLLTTGIELPGMSDEGIGRMVDALSTARVAGIALELGTVVADAPEALVAAASRNELPLIGFTRRVKFVEITHAVAEVQLAAEVQRLRRAVSVQSRLREAARDRHGPAAILSALATALAAELLVEQTDGTPLLTAPPNEGLSTRFLEALAAERAGGPSPLITRAVVIPGRGSARLHALLPEPTELDELTVSEAAFLLGAALAAEPRLDELLADDRARLVRLLAEGRAASAADVRRRIRSVGLDLAGEDLTVIVARGVGSAAALRALVEPPVLAEAVGAGRARGLVLAGGAGLVHDLGRAVRDRPGAAIGIATAGTEPWAIRTAFEAADRAALVALALDRRVVDAAATGPLDPIAAAVLAGRRLVAPLSDRDERLLEALVAAGFSIAPAARRLGVSRQAVYKALRRAEVRLGVGLLDPGAHAEVSLRLLAHRMQRAVAEDG
jgi:purine catabolism regulator